VKVVLSATAAREFAVAVEWWRENRPAAPTLLEDEMALELRRLADVPFLGQAVLNGRLRGLRRILLEETRYHLFYRVHENRGLVWVVRLWHQSRSSPKLPKR
jgi:plasmid stabilization system protein ParE